MKRFVLIAALALVGCAQPGPKPLYQWAGYQNSVYQYLKSNGGEPGAQIAALEAQLDKNKAAGEVTPPGMRAHLALLYSKVGDEVAAQRHLEAERAQFPESSAYVDFLLKTAQKDAGKNAASAPAAAASQPRT
ncbi:hypothetical protein ASC95_12945 [Pelomonas sp. Root1217]|uniref:DUF4810 domain-containing protein n=1 Tax=Pelomonas sp. Root1217 TaxID=1736430 RepID=UPI00070B6DF9|nr:DUF4810 domain-containing protein [Pelomonas sp. Root1217]KQV50289.1 hypothetical protein ASC95_12945 [Pelomonas sp. Root1217]